MCRSVRLAFNRGGEMRLWSKVCASGVIMISTMSCATGPICTDEVVPGLVVEIRDAFDDSPVAETGRGAVHEGEFIDSLQPYGRAGNGVLISRAGADERAGLYSVTVVHEGYFDWRVDGVRVRRANVMCRLCG